MSRSITGTRNKEDAALQRLRELHNPDNTREQRRERWGGDSDQGQLGGMASHGNHSLKQVEWSEDEKFMQVCIKVAQQNTDR